MNKIIGLGNALVDVLAPLKNDEILKELELPKGSMTWVSEDKLLRIRELFKHIPTSLVTGGSAGNTIRALACLGADAGFIGKVGKDKYGDFYRQSLSDRGVDVHLIVSPDLPSGVANTFISPDGERTFGDYLGAAASLCAEDLSADMFKGYAYLLVEGYLIQDHAMILRAIQLAKEAGLKICLDLASYNIVLEDRDFFRQLLEQHTDIVFANEEEAKAYTGEEAEAAVQALGSICHTAVVKVGKQGSIIRRGSETVQVPATPVEKVVDTTGAGDYFAAGFLYGLTNGYTLEQSGKIGSLLAGEVIQVIGTELPAERWRHIRAVCME